MPEGLQCQPDLLIVQGETLDRHRNNTTLRNGDNAAVLIQDACYVNDNQRLRERFGFNFRNRLRGSISKEVRNAQCARLCAEIGECVCQCARHCPEIGHGPRERRFVCLSVRVGEGARLRTDFGGT